MEFKIIAHGNTGKDRIDLLHKSAKFYAQYLNIIDFKYTVTICNTPNLRELAGNNGSAGKTGNKEITILIDSKLKLPQLLITLAHEMIHAKQYVRGQFRGDFSPSGKIKGFWLGKKYVVDYLNRPWEIEAFRRETELALALLETVVQKAKKKKRST